MKQYADPLISAKQWIDQFMWLRLPILDISFGATQDMMGRWAQWGPSESTPGLKANQIAYGNNVDPKAQQFKVSEQMWRPNILDVDNATDAEWTAFFDWVHKTRLFSISADMNQDAPLVNHRTNSDFTYGVQQLSEAAGVDLFYEYDEDGNPFENYTGWMIRTGMLRTDLGENDTVRKPFISFDVTQWGKESTKPEDNSADPVEPVTPTTETTTTETTTKTEVVPDDVAKFDAIFGDEETSSVGEMPPPPPEELEIEIDDSLILQREERLKQFALKTAPKR